MIELLGCSLIIIILCLEAYWIHRIYKIICERSADKDPARRAAVRPRMYKAVHKEWSIDRNRRELFEHLMEGEIYESNTF